MDLSARVAPDLVAAATVTITATSALAAREWDTVLQSLTIMARHQQAVIKASIPMSTTGIAAECAEGGLYQFGFHAGESESPCTQKQSSLTQHRQFLYPQAPLTMHHIRALYKAYDCA